VLALAALAGVRSASAEFDPDEKRFDNAAYPADFRRRVTESIDRCAKWILSRQAADGSWASPTNGAYPIGASALCTLALLKAGMPPDHPRIESAFRHLRTLPLKKTYEVSILLMALDARYDPAPDPFAVEQVDRYGERVVAEPCAENVSKDDLAWMRQGVDFLVSNQASGVWRYPSGGFDLSNTQYALLGLKAAVRCGIKVPSRVWTDALDFLLDHQEQDGPEVSLRANEVKGAYRIEWTEKAKARGFAYVAGNKVSSSMTTAGAAGLMICQSELWRMRRFGGEKRARTRVAIRDALAWLQANFTVKENRPFGSAHHYYYLYGLERTGIVGHVRFLGEADWYWEGAHYLLASQEGDGSWRGPLHDTCFALLFLKRGSVRTANPTITPFDAPLPPDQPK
jgi:hypothetical protein